MLVLRGEGALGDAVLSSFLYRELKKVNPSLKITVACFGAVYAFLKCVPDIDQLYVLPVSSRLRAHQRWFSLLWAAWKLRQKHFDLVLDTSFIKYPNWRAFKCVCSIGDTLLDAEHCPVQLGEPNLSIDQHVRAIAVQLGVKEPCSDFVLPVPQQTEDKINQFIQQNVPNGYVCLNLFGSVSARTFTLDSYRLLVEKLKKYGLPIVLPYMPGQKETVLAYLDAENENVKAYQTSDVSDLFALVRGARVVLSPDTAVVHIATGFHKPTVGFYSVLAPCYIPNNPLAQVISCAESDINSFATADLEKALAEVFK